MSRIINCLLIIVIMSLVTSQVSGGENDRSKSMLVRTEICYKNSLETGNIGVRNSALLEIVKMQALYPNVEFPCLKRAIKKMIKNEPEVVIRTNAQMALEILENPHMANLVDSVDEYDPNAFFDKFYLKIAEKFAESQIALE